MFRRRLRVTSALLPILLLAACRSAEDPEAQSVPLVPPPVVDIVVSDFAFDAPGELPSGWTTFSMANIGAQEHFGLLWRLPEGKRLEDYGAEVGAVFARVWERYEAGELDRDGAAQALADELPDWFAELVPSGGPALTEPGEVSQATVLLAPGIHVLECYVKTPEGVWHTMLGMVHEITVTSESTGASPPQPDIELTLANYQAAVAGDLSAGTHTVAVHVLDSPEGLMKHDINLFRLDGETSVDEIISWMDWMDLGGFRAPAPGHSLGGVEHLPAGSVGFMTVTLTPGRYAWVSEGYGSQGVVSEFVVD